MADSALESHAKLNALASRVWPGWSDDFSPVAVSLGAPPENHVAVESYAVVPNLTRARFLVPLGSRPAAVGSLWAYHTMRTTTRRMAEATVAGLFHAGLGARVFGTRLVVSVDRKVPRAEYPTWLLLSHLSNELDAGELFAGMAVRRVQPNAKPMLELFDGQGVPQGYAKIGWSTATKDLVRSEAHTLAELSDHLDTVIAPSLLAHSAWNDSVYSVASPLPRGLRRWGADPFEAPEATIDVATSVPVMSGTLAGSGYAEGVRAELTAATAHAPRECQVLGEWLDRLEQDPAPLRFGRWHGDWTPHNLGHTRRRVAAWDWEHSRVGVPVGFDALHWHYQDQLTQGGLSAAVAEVRKVSASLGAVGVSAEARRLVSSLYLLEMFVRTVRLAVGGGGWNARVHPEMLTVAAQMDGDGR